MGVPGDAPQRIDRDSLGAHVDRHHRHAGVLGGIGVGADGGEPPLAQVRQAGPDLLAGDAPTAVHSFRRGAHRGSIGTCTGFGEQLAPHHLPPQHRLDPAFTLVLGTGLGDGQRDPPGDAHVRALDSGELLLDDELFEHGGAPPPRLRPVRDQIAGVDQEIALLFGGQRADSGRGLPRRSPMVLGFRGQRERGAVRLAAAPALHHVEQRVTAVGHQRRERARPAQIQVCVVLPGVADAAMKLDVVLRGGHLRADRQRGGDSTGEPGAVEVVGASGVPRRGRGDLDVDEHVGGVVFDRLEGADGPAELFADLGVFDRHLQCGPPDSHRLGGGQDAPHGPGVACCPPQHPIWGHGHPAQCHRAQAAGGVQGIQCGDGDAVGGRVDDHEIVAGGQDQQVGVGRAQYGGVLAGGDEVGAHGHGSGHAERRYCLTGRKLRD